VQQMYKLYGAHHYDHYDFLVSLSDKMSGNGLEHHRSSEDGTSADFFTEWNKNAAGRDLFSHEFNHSWDGKYRRGADLATPSFNVPMSDTLLWVYEGQTQFWGHVMAARSGLWSDEMARDQWAYTASVYDKGRPGLASWRNVQDTTNDPIIGGRGGQPYHNYQGRQEYYSAGQMIWLEVDAKLRELSGNKKTIDNFGKAFFGMENGKWDVNTYTFEDVVKTLNTIQPFDWASYLRERLDGHGPLIGGLASHGWTLVYTDKPNLLIQASEKERNSLNAFYSLGFSITKDGLLEDVIPGSPAYAAGVGPGMKLVAVNARRWSKEVLREALRATKSTGTPLELLLENRDFFKTYSINYHGGEQYPHLERAEGDDLLGRISAPRAGSK